MSENNGAKREIKLYSSNPEANGFEYNEETKRYELRDGEEIIIWDEDAEWDMFRDNFEAYFTKAPGWVAQGKVCDWEGISDGGNVFIGNTFDQIMGKFANNVDAYGEMTVLDIDGNLFVRTTNHDGFMEMQLRMLTQRGVDYCVAHRYDRPRDVHAKVFGTRYSKKAECRRV